MVFHAPTLVGSGTDAARGHALAGLGEASSTVMLDGESELYVSGDSGATWSPAPPGVPTQGAARLYPTSKGTLRDYGDALHTANASKHQHVFNGTYTRSWTGLSSPPFVSFARDNNTRVAMLGLPHDVWCEYKHFGGCPIRLQGTGLVCFGPSDSPGTECVMSVIVFWGGNGEWATSVLAFGSTDGGLQWHFRAVVANASANPDAQEGPNENDLALIPVPGSGTGLRGAAPQADPAIAMVIRWDAGDGPQTHPYRDYRVVVSTDRGHTWSKPRVLEGLGCARPRLLPASPPLAAVHAGGRGAAAGGSGALPAAPMLLSGGRMRDHGTSDVLLWVDWSGTALLQAAGSEPEQEALDAFEEFSLSYWHNKGETNETLRFTPNVNSTSFSPRETMSYTSIIPVPPEASSLTDGRVPDASVLLTYNKQPAHGKERYLFSMRADLFYQA